MRQGVRVSFLFESRVLHAGMEDFWSIRAFPACDTLKVNKRKERK
ncbi:hypothetical protein CLV97_11387 [Planifilum fimeticola]|uniref:Uncharacterized protein n=1 Tax=Planifilum fimeticola TaxID=201975 RepID=A0A2T0LEG6_9BACL|nr:hypothetical protein CLV97_11387 [Planifilum fimeticola]